MTPSYKPVTGVLHVRYNNKEYEYREQAIKALEVSFGNAFLNDEVLLRALRSSIPVMEGIIKSVLEESTSTDVHDLRCKLALEVIPFLHVKSNRLPIETLPKMDERRLLFQALYLFILRPHLPLKYPTMDAFLEAYPNLVKRNYVEQERLRRTANWMSLTFYTTGPKNYKTFLMNLIPRMVEGKGARYITGTGETIATADRVAIYRTEGECVKVNRMSRKKRKLLIGDTGLEPPRGPRASAPKGFQTYYPPTFPFALPYSNTPAMAYPPLPPVPYPLTMDNMRHMQTMQAMAAMYPYIPQSTAAPVPSSPPKTSSTFSGLDMLSSVAGEFLSLDEAVAKGLTTGNKGRN